MLGSVAFTHFLTSSETLFYYSQLMIMRLDKHCLRLQTRFEIHAHSLSEVHEQMPSVLIYTLNISLQMGISVDVDLHTVNANCVAFILPIDYERYEELCLVNNYHCH